MRKIYALESLGLVDGPEDPSLSNIAELSARVLDAPISLVTIIDFSKKRQFFTASFGLPDELESSRQTPLDMSICKFVKELNKPIRIFDLLVDERTKLNSLVHTYGLRSYAGAPIHCVAGKVIGTLCCLKTVPWAWSDDELKTLAQLARSVDDLIKSRVVALEQSKANTKLKQLSAAKSGFIAHMSHEIRTPLTGIVGSIRLLNTMGLEGEPGQLVSLMDRSSLRLLDVVNDTLDLARLDSGHFRLTEERCNLRLIADDVVDAYRQLAADKPISLKVTDNLHGEEWLADKNAISSIIHNLFGNAVKFTDEGYAELSLSVDDFGQVTIQVIDTGIGIPKEYHAKIFEEFEQAGPTVARAYGGTGLGMAIVKRLVEAMDGTITLTSEVGKGTTIVVTLPLEIAVQIERQSQSR